MKRLISTAVLLALILTVAPAVHAQRKKGQKGKNNEVKTLETSPADYQALKRYPGIYGKVLSFDAAKKKISLRVEYQTTQQVAPKKKPGNQKAGQKKRRPGKNINANKNRRPKNFNGNKQRRPGKNFNGKKKRQPNKGKGRPGRTGKGRGASIQQLAREYQQIMRIKNPVQRNLRLRKFQAKMNLAQQRELQNHLRLLQKQANQFKKKQKSNNPNVKVIAVAKEFDLAIADNVHVARKTLPFAFDDKGHLKEYTDDEKKKLKHPHLPAYQAKLEDVMMGQYVYVYFTKIEKAKTEKAKDEETKNEKEPELNLPVGTGQSLGPAVTAIVIVADADLSAQGGNRANKRRKN